ncbi:MAG: hypothetical protein ACOCRL_00445 [Bacillota bacterium]
MRKNLLKKEILKFCQDELDSKKIICEILKQYFIQKEYLNGEFVSKMSVEFPELVIKYIKRYKAFLKNEHFQIFIEKFQKHSNAEINNFYKEIVFLKNISEQINGYVSSKFDFTLKKIHIVDLLIHMGLYYEKVRLVSKSQIEFESKEVNIIETFNQILNKKLSLDSISNNINLNDISFVKKMSEIINKNKVDRKIEKMIIVYDQLQQFNHLINLYCFNNWEIKFVTNKKIKLEPSNEKEYKNWIKNGNKYLDYRKWNLTHDNIHLTNNAKGIMQDININKYSRQVNFKTLSNFIQYLDTCLPEIIEYNNNKFEINHAFNCLNLLSENSNSRYLDLFNKPSLRRDLKNLNYLDKISYIIRNGRMNRIITGPLMFRREKDLINGGLQTGASPKELVNIFNFLSNDLIKNKQVDLSLRPFIKINNLYFWNPGILANKNYAVILQNNVMKRRIYNHREQSEKMEEKLLELFKLNDFNTLENYEYNSLTPNNKIDGEIDLLAFKDNTLFIIELKTTFARSTVREIYNHEEHALNKKAGEQLERASKYIKERFSEIKDKLGINVSYEEIKRYPLVVSTSFEGDYFSIKGKFKKISFFELKLILTNTKYWIFFEDIFDNEIKNLLAKGLEAEAIKKNTELFDKHHKNLKEIQAQHNLWSQSKQCSSEDLISAIEEDKVWKHLDNKNYDLLKDKIISREYEILYYY